jgi:hypothetical protein
VEKNEEEACEAEVRSEQEIGTPVMVVGMERKQLLRTLTNAALDSVHFTGAGKNGLESADGSNEVLCAALQTSSGISSRLSVNSTEWRIRLASFWIV